jgi:hypothetical protein
MRRVFAFASRLFGKGWMMGMEGKYLVLNRQRKNNLM